MRTSETTGIAASLVWALFGGSGCVDDGSGLLSPGGALTIEAAGLPEASLDVPYRAEVTALRGTPPYRWSVASGALPGGLGVAVAGAPSTTITGIPTTGGAFEFRLAVEDASGARAENDFVLLVRDARPLSVVTTEVPAGRLGEAYSTTISVAGGVPPYRWSRLGDLPAGVSFEGGTPAATVAGTPTEAGVFSFSVEVMDEVGDRVERAFELVVAPRDVPLRIVTGDEVAIRFPDARFDREYTSVLAAEGGVGPYLWSLSGALPVGLQLRPSGTPDTLVFGTVAELGSFSGVITVTDARGAIDTKAFSLEVVAGVGLLEIATSTLAAATACVPFEATVTARAGSGRGYRWRIVGGTLPPGLSLRPDGTPSTAIVGTTLRRAVGAHAVTVEVTDDEGNRDTRTLTLEVVDSGVPWSVALSGDLEVDNRHDLYLADICGPLPTPTTRVSTNSGVGARVSVDDQYRVLSPDGRNLAFETVGQGAGVFVSEVRRGVPGPPIRVSGTGWGAGYAFTTLRFSPDGRRLAFLAHRLSDGTDDVLVVDLSGPTVPDSAVIVTPQIHAAAEVAGLNGTGVAFSADSSQLAFVSDAEVDGEFELWVADVTTLRARSAVRATDCVAGGDVRSRQVVPVPGGAGFLVVGDVLTRGVTELFSIDGAARPPTATRISAPTPPGGSVLWAAGQFGLDRSGTIAWYFADQTSDAAMGAWRVHLATPGLATPLSGAAVAGSRIHEASRLGAHGLVVRGSLLDADRPDLFLFDLDGPPMQPLLAARVNAPTPGGSGVTNGATAVSPDGSWIAFVEGARPTAHVARVIGSTAQAPIPVSRPVPGFVPQFDQIEFAPDGASVTFVGRFDNLAVNDAYVVPLGASVPGPWRRVTRVAHAGGVQDLFYVSPSALVIRGDLAIDDDVDAFLLELDDPTLTPVRISSRGTSGVSDVARIFAP